MSLPMLATDPTETDRLSDSDEDLAARAGTDPLALTELYLRYRPRVENYCRLKLGNHAQAEDVTAQVFLNVLEALRKQRVTRFRPWLFTIVHNEIVNVFRTARPTVPVDLIVLHRPDETTSAEADARSDLAYIRSLLPCLIETERQVIDLRLFGLTNPEIAEVLGRTYSWVATTQHRALHHLQHLVAEQTPAEACIQ